MLKFKLIVENDKAQKSVKKGASTARGNNSISLFV